MRSGADAKAQPETDARKDWVPRPLFVYWYRNSPGQGGVDAGWLGNDTTGVPVLLTSPYPAAPARRTKPTVACAPNRRISNRPGRIGGGGLSDLAVMMRLCRRLPLRLPRR